MKKSMQIVSRKERSVFRECLVTRQPVSVAAMVGLAAMGFSASIFAAGQSSANFAIPRDAINAGIADMSSTSFRLSSSVGEAIAGSAIGSVSFQLKSGFRASVNAPPAVLNLLSVFSRKFHNGLPFDLAIDRNQTINGTITVEPRASSGAGHTIIFRFDGVVTAEGAATALDAALNSAATVTLSRSGSDVIATLANVADNKRLTIKLTGVVATSSATTNAEAAMGFLVGDVGNSRQVTAADIAAVKANLNKPVNSIGIAKFDLNADGSITQADVSAAKARAGMVLAP